MGRKRRDTATSPMLPSSHPAHSSHWCQWEWLGEGINTRSRAGQCQGTGRQPLRAAGGDEDTEVTNVTAVLSAPRLPHGSGVLAAAAPAQLLFMIHQDAGERGREVQAAQGYGAAEMGGSGPAAQALWRVPGTQL